MNKFSVGDIVRHTGEFLRSVGWYTNVPINGKVTNVSDRYVYVLWSDRNKPKPINPANIEKDPRV